MGPQEDYIETVFTCKGDFNDPNLQLQLEEFSEGLRNLLLSDSCKEELILKKVEPWNSVRVTFNIPRAAALKLKQLAQQGDTNLRRLGVLAVQIEGDQSISLTIAGKNNERTEIVFKTGLGEATSEPSTSALDGTSAENKRKHSLDFLRQNNVLLDPLLSQLGAGGPGSLLQSPNVVATSSDPIPFLNTGSTTVESVAKLPGIEQSPFQGLVFPPGRSPTGYPNSPGQSWPLGKNAGQLRPSYSGYGHGRPETIAPQRQTLGNLLLPPPPPYPHPQVVSVNNFQKQTRPMTSSSPLLVNLLQNDPSGGLLNNFTQEKLPELLEGSIEALALAKKRRKKRKKKRLAAEAAAREAAAQEAAAAASQEAALLAEGMINTDIASTSAHSLPGFNKSIKSKFSQPFGQAADHSTLMLDHVSETDTGKLVNPYTGLLEPADEAGESASVSVSNDQSEKIDTIQAAINRVAAAWTAHVTTSEEVPGTSMLCGLPSTCSITHSTTTTPFSYKQLVATGLPPYSMPCNTSYLSPLSSAMPSHSKGSSMDTITSSSVCDRSTNSLPLNRHYDISLNSNNTSCTAESLNREPLLAMQHVTYSVGLSSASWQAGSQTSVSSSSHMQKQLSNMQGTITPNLSQIQQRLEDQNSADRPIISSHFSSSISVDGHYVPGRHQARTPPHSKAGSLPMAHQLERPRSTGSYPLSISADGKSSLHVTSGILNFTALSDPSNKTKSYHSPIRTTQSPVQSSGSCVSNVTPRGNPTCASQTITSTVGSTQLSTGAPPQTDISQKGSEEINNSNHDSGLSSQSENADDNHLTDETASSCGTQGSPPFNVNDGVKVEQDKSHPKVKPQLNKPVALPHSPHVSSVSASGNPLYHKDIHMSGRVSALSSNPGKTTVLHWSTMDGLNPTRAPNTGHMGPVGDPKNSSQLQHVAVSQSASERKHLSSSVCLSPEHAKSVESVRERLLPYSKDHQTSVYLSEITKLSGSITSGTESMQASASVDHRVDTVPTFRTQNYPLSVIPVSREASDPSKMDTHGIYPQDVHVSKPGPIMSSTIYHGPEAGSMRSKPFNQPSAILGGSNVNEVRPPKAHFENSPSIRTESHAGSLSRLAKLHQSSAASVLVPGNHAPTDSLQHFNLPIHYSAPGMISYSSPSLQSQSSCSNSLVGTPVPTVSQWKNVTGSHSPKISQSFPSSRVENCKTLTSSNIGHSEALKSLQNFINPMNVQMCNTNPPTLSSIGEANPAVSKSNASGVNPEDQRQISGNSQNALTNQMGHLQPHHPIGSDGDTNGPNQPSENQHAIGANVTDYLSHLNDNTDLSINKTTHQSLSQFASLPLISTEILDQELSRSCIPSELQMLEDKIDMNSLTSLQERNIVQRAVVGGSKSPGHSAALLATSPDHLKGSNVTSIYTRKSPSGKSGSGLSMLSMFASDLPLPKLLTESMQKVVKPLPGSMKDTDGAAKMARRNQTASHTNLHSHNATSPYSKSPPLGYEAVQGASSVLTPPKSPVRFGPGEAPSKPQSPRAWNPNTGSSQSALNPNSHHLVVEASHQNGDEVNHLPLDTAHPTQTLLGATSLNSEQPVTCDSASSYTQPETHPPSSDKTPAEQSHLNVDQNLCKTDVCRSVETSGKQTVSTENDSKCGSSETPNTNTPTKPCSNTTDSNTPVDTPKDSHGNDQIEPSIPCVETNSSVQDVGEGSKDNNVKQESVEVPTDPNMPTDSESASEVKLTNSLSADSLPPSAIDTPSFAEAVGQSADTPTLQPGSSSIVSADVQVTCETSSNPSHSSQNCLNDAVSHPESNCISTEYLDGQANCVDHSAVSVEDETDEHTNKEDVIPESSSKVLRGGKSTKIVKTPKRKEEDMDSKASELDSSHQLRQRRSRRRLADNEGNGESETENKRSKVDGLDESLDHQENDDVGHILPKDADGNDQNDVTNVVEEPLEDGAVFNTQLPRSTSDDKLNTRQTKDNRKGADNSKPVLRDLKRDVKQNAAVIENDLKRGRGSDRLLRGNDEEHVTRSSRRNRVSPSTGPDKTGAQGTRERSPVRGTRNRTPDQKEDSPEPQYKRTTRSTKPKEQPDPVTTSNRRRRASRDHR